MMTALRTRICTYAIAVLVTLGLATPSLAGSSTFTGVYAAVKGSMAGAQFDGTHTDNDGQVTKGKGGGVSPVFGVELGVNIPLGDVFFLGVGVTQNTGKATLGYADDADSQSGESDVRLDIQDLRTFYIQPSISIFDNSAIYLKYADSDVELAATGAVQTAPPSNLNGKTYAVGTMTMADNGLFVKTEAGATDWDQFTMQVTGTSVEGTTVANDVEANPLMAFGSISIGYKF